MKDNIHLTSKQARELARLLGKYQDYLEDAIHSVLLPGKTEVDPRLGPSIARAVARDRKDWKQAEGFVKLLTNLPRRIK